MPENSPLEPFTSPQRATPATPGISDLSSRQGSGTLTASPQPTTQTIETARGPSPLQRQRRTSRVTPDPNPVSITFLSGPYQGQRLEVGQWLGAMVSEASHEIGAQWEEREADGIRCGSNFRRLSARTFSLSVTFYDLEFDISHLVEGLACLLQIGGNVGGGSTATPPFLLLRQGDLIAKPVFCTSVSPSYSEPYAGRTGFKTAEVKLSFQLQAGKDSENALGKPLTSTPLTDWLENTSQQQRQRQGVTAVAQEILAPCLGAEGNRQLLDLIARDRLGDLGSVLRLDRNAFVQAAIAGMIRPSILADEAVQQKLRQDLARVMAEQEDGIGATGGHSPDRFAEALLNGTTNGVAADLQAQALQAIGDFELILSNVSAQTLTEESEVFDQVKNPTAGNRLRTFGSCGLTMRQIGAPTVRGSSPADVKTLQEINAFLANKDVTDEQIRERFGLETDSQARVLRRGAPYDSKDQFIARTGRAGVLTGHALWGNFVERTPKPEPEPNPTEPAPTENN